MSATEFYGPGMRAAQEHHDSTRLANRLAEITLHDRFSEDDKAFIASADMVFVATADAAGRPDCSYKGGVPGFIKVLDDTSLAIPIYDGNGQYRTVGNILDNPSVGLLFIDFAGRRRLRVNGTATVERDEQLVDGFEGAESVIVVRLRHAFPNCPRYVHDVASGTPSEYAPSPGHTPPEPAWKSYEVFQPYLPAR